MFYLIDTGILDFQPNADSIGTVVSRHESLSVAVARCTSIADDAQELGSPPPRILIVESVEGFMDAQLFPRHVAGRKFDRFGTLY
jgi:hypothetical protein